MTRRLPTRRAGFTFVELLIVIAIIGLLAALLLAGISRVNSLARTATASADISQLEAACQKFKTDYGFNPPSGFTIPVRVTDPGFVTLKTMFSRWTGNPDMAGNITPALANAGTTLDNNQSMVYFLGGPNQTGWATDAPYAPSATATAIKPPLFDFKQDRLDGALGGPRRYLDPFKNNFAPNGTPYAYFGSGVGGRYTLGTSSITTGAGTFTVDPFVEQVSGTTVSKFVNQGGVQIVSAGEDGKFGPGCPGPASTPPSAVQCKYVAGQSAVGSGISPYGEGDAGADDVGNFNGGSKLGVGR